MTTSFDDLVLALASSAEAVLNTFTVSGTGGSPRVAGIWSEVKSDMEKLLPGALVRLHDEGDGEPKFGLIPTSGALSTRNGRLHVKISMDGHPPASPYLPTIFGHVSRLRFNDHDDHDDFIRRFSACPRV